MATKEVVKRKKIMKARSKTSRNRTIRRRQTRRNTNRRRCHRRGGVYLPSDATIAAYRGIPIDKDALMTKAAGADSFTGTLKEMKRHNEYRDFQGGPGDGTN